MCSCTRGGHRSGRHALDELLVSSHPAGALLGRVGGQRLKPVRQIDAGWRWWRWNRVSGGQQAIEHGFAVLRFRVEQPREQADAELDRFARRGAGLFLQVVAKLFLDLVGLEIPTRDALEQTLIAAERPGRQLPGLRREVLKPSAPFSRL